MQSEDAFIEIMFPNITRNFVNHNWLSERAILAGTNKDVDGINFDVLTKIRGDIVVYRSFATIVNEGEAVNYPVEFLNSLDLSIFASHLTD